MSSDDQKWNPYSSPAFEIFERMDRLTAPFKHIERVMEPFRMSEQLQQLVAPRLPFAQVEGIFKHLQLEDRFVSPLADAEWLKQMVVPPILVNPLFQLPDVFSPINAMTERMSKVAGMLANYPALSVSDLLAASLAHEQGSDDPEEHRVQEGEISELLDHRSKPIERDTRIRIVQVGDELLALLAEDPQLLHKLDPRKFEEVVAELYRKRGFDVELTKQTRDGGVDIYARSRDPHLPLLFLVECKRHNPSRPVAVEVVRSLFGVVTHQDASMGVVATNSSFTRDAREWIKPHINRMALHDYEVLASWLRETRPGDARRQGRR